MKDFWNGFDKVMDGVSGLFASAEQELDRRFDDMEKIMAGLDNGFFMYESKTEAKVNGTQVKSVREFYIRLKFRDGDFPKKDEHDRELPIIGETYKHKNGDQYKVYDITNCIAGIAHDKFPITVSYINAKGQHLSTPLHRWVGSFTHVPKANEKA